MSYTGIAPFDTLGLATTIDPAGSLAGVEVNVLPPPGRQWDATADLHPPKKAHYPAVVHQLTSLMGGTITTGQVWTAIVHVVSTSQGSGVASQFVDVPLSITVGGTQTATAVADLFVTAAIAASTTSTLASVDTTTRLSEIATFTAAAGTITMDAAEAGLVFTVVFTPEAGGTAPVVITPGRDADKADLRVGIWVAYDPGVMATDGVTPIVRLLASGDTAANIYGVVMDGSRNQPIPADGVYDFVSYKDGRDVPIIPKSGRFTALSELAVTHAADVWARVVATGDEVAGASTGTPGVQVNTITTTPVNATVYSGFVQVTDGDGALVATSPFNYLSDGSATDAEIVTGITADLTGSDVDAFLTLGGTTTLILTPDAGFTALLISTGVGVLTPALTPAAPTHVKVGPKFARASVAGIGDVTYEL